MIKYYIQTGKKKRKLTEKQFDNIDDMIIGNNMTATLFGIKSNGEKKIIAKYRKGVMQ